jgi:hypothetical protein
VAAAAIALAFAGLWPAVHPPLVHLPTSDLYGQLSVARHLARGEGFLDDVVYPLSFAFPFAVRLPQPLIQRGPLYPLLLVLPFWAGHGDPATVLADVRWLQVLLLTLLVWIGIDGLLRRGRPPAVRPWCAACGCGGGGDGSGPEITLVVRCRERWCPGTP